MLLCEQPDALADVLECTIAASDADREQVYRLRYACYLRTGAIEARATRSFADGFDTMPNQFSFLLRAPGCEPVATVRISVVRPDLGWTESPARSVFGDHPAFQAVHRESFVEASRLCFASQARRDLLMRLLGNAAALADYYQSEWLVACPRLEYAPLYLKQFGFRVMAEPRQYFGVNFQTQLLGIRRDELRVHISSNKPMRNAWVNAMVYLLRARPQRAEAGESDSRPQVRWRCGAASGAATQVCAAES